MNEIEIYTTRDGKTNIEVRFESETVWLNQYQMSELFETDRTSIQKHLQNIYFTHELNKNSTCAKIAQVHQEGNRIIKRDILHFNLDAIISVGYRVNSKRGILFRQWATQRLKDYLVKGYALNTNRLQQVESKYKELQHAVGLISSIAAKKVLTKKLPILFLLSEQQLL